jgi:hypothetical protein
MQQRVQVQIPSIRTTITTTISFFLPSSSYLDGPVLALAIIELSLIFHHVALTQQIAIYDAADVTEDGISAV